jgi:hypothetical protein
MNLTAKKIEPQRKTTLPYKQTITTMSEGEGKEKICVI